MLEYKLIWKIEESIWLELISRYSTWLQNYTSVAYTRIYQELSWIQRKSIMYIKTPGARIISYKLTCFKWVISLNTCPECEEPVKHCARKSLWHSYFKPMLLTTLQRRMFLQLSFKCTLEKKTQLHKYEEETVNKSQMATKRKKHMIFESGKKYIYRHILHQHW
jgi:hypothetical protein